MHQCTLHYHDDHINTQAKVPYSQEGVLPMPTCLGHAHIAAMELVAGATRHWPSTAKVQQHR